MTKSPGMEIPLVSRLIELAKREDRGAMAALRSGLGKPPGAAPRMFPIVARFISVDDGPATQAAFVIAALFGKHPEHAEIGSVGASLWRATRREDANPTGKHGEAGVEARLVATLDANPEDLARHLDGLVSLCQSAGVPIDWHRLYVDVRGLLGRNEGYQQRIRTRWAREFWRGPSHDAQSDRSNREEDNK